MAQIYGVLFSAFLGLLGLTILWLIWTRRINLTDLLNEANGQASMSRFQLLVFTFVIAISLFGVTEAKKDLPDIPSGILTLLGISASTYAVGKGISYSAPEVMMGTGPSGDGDDSDEEADAAATHADDAKAHADAAKQAAQQAQEALNAQRAVAQQAADSAAQAKQAAEQAKVTKS